MESQITPLKTTKQNKNLSLFKTTVNNIFKCVLGGYFLPALGVNTGNTAVAVQASQDMGLEN